MFGNVTGGGALSSKTNYNPTPYVPVVDASITQINSLENDPFESYPVFILLHPSDLYYITKKLLY